jgi:PTS system nitrogen regulatory IIA component
VKLTDLICKKAILLNIKSREKRGAIQELVQAARKSNDGERFVVSDIVDAIVQREKIGSTGVGGGIGVPHAKIDGIRGVIGAFGRSESGLDFSAVDAAPVDILFLILAPPSKSDAYLKALQKIMAAIKQPNTVKFLRGAKTAKDVEEIFREVEEVAPV